MINEDQLAASKPIENSWRKEGGLRTRGEFSKQSMPGSPLVTVITVVRNGKEHLEGAIQSVLNQTYDNIEHIIIDGSSTDGTLDIIKGYDEKIAYWMSEPDNGLYDAMNKGILLAHGTLIGLLNSDDFYEKQAVQYVVDRYARRNRERAVIVYGNFNIYDEDLHITTQFLSNLNYRRGMTVCHQTMFVERSVYLTMSLYDTSYKFAADYDFFLKAIFHDIEFLNTDAFLVNFRNTGATYLSVPLVYKETVSINRRYFGCFNIQFLVLILKAVRIVIQSAVKHAVELCFGKKVLKKVKIIQNTLSRKAWRNIAP